MNYLDFLKRYKIDVFLFLIFGLLIGFNFFGGIGHTALFAVRRILTALAVIAFAGIYFGIRLRNQGLRKALLMLVVISILMAIFAVFVGEFRGKDAISDILPAFAVIGVLFNVFGIPSWGIASFLFNRNSNPS